MLHHFSKVWYSLFCKLNPVPGVANQILDYILIGHDSVFNSIHYRIPSFKGFSARAILRILVRNCFLWFLSQLLEWGLSFCQPYVGWCLGFPKHILVFLCPSPELRIAYLSARENQAFWPCSRPLSLTKMVVQISWT